MADVTVYIKRAVARFPYAEHRHSRELELEPLSSHIHQRMLVFRFFWRQQNLMEHAL